MIRQCFLANTGIRFHAPLLAAIGLDPESLYPVVKTRPPAIFYSPPAIPIVDSVAPSSGHPATSEDATKPLINYAEPPADTSESKAVGLGYGNVLLSSILSEEEEDLADALCPIFDQLRLAPLWWLLEVMPITLRTQREGDNEWNQNLRRVAFCHSFKTTIRNIHFQCQPRPPTCDPKTETTWLLCAPQC